MTQPHLIQTTDNNCGNCQYDKCDKENLAFLSRHTIGKLQTENQSSLFVFPPKKDWKDDIENKYIFSLIGENNLQTSNIMGYIGYKGTRLRIHSRFAKDDEQDFFLHYMLQRVMHINLFDLKYSTADDEIFDFLLYLFPAFLKRAMAQGLYREYQTKQYNDSHVRGRIDISRHIRQNTPFTGRIAYSTREYSADNSVTQLIRHTIEYLRHKPLGNTLLQDDEDAKDYVRQITDATNSTYNLHERRKIISQNMRPLNHPYYGEYRQLQKLCLQILQHKELKYRDTDNNEIYGILFDGAWLWEEYLAIVLKDVMSHYTQKNSSFKLFKKEDGKEFQQIVPDFYDKDQHVVADAKYIPLAEKENLSGDQALSIYYKTVMYMYRFNCPTGYLFYPYSNSSDIHSEVLTVNNGQRERLIKAGLSIPKGITDWHIFVEGIKQSEEKFKKPIIEKHVR